MRTTIQRLVASLVFTTILGSAVAANYSTVVSQLSLISAGQIAVPAPEQAPPVPIPQPIDAADDLTVARPWHMPISVDGYLTGRLQGINEGYRSAAPAVAQPVLFIQNGNVVSEAKTGPGGVFQAAGVSEGKYSMVVLSPEGFAATAFYVSAREGMRAPDSGLDVTMIAPPDVERAFEFIDMSGSQSGPEGAILSTDDLSMRFVSRDEPVFLNADGSANLRVVSPERDFLRAVPRMDVFFLRDGNVVAEGRTDAEGLVTVMGLAAGQYSVIGSGEGRFLAIGVKVEDYVANAPVTEQNANADGTQFVSFHAAANSPLAAIAGSLSAQDLAFLQQIIAQLRAAQAANQFGNMGGGTGPGGGFGAGGDLLPLLLAAGLGALLGALLGDDNGNKKVVSPVGP